MSIDLTAVAGLPTGAALARLCSATPDEFAQQVWARRAWLSPGSDLPGDVRDLFSLEAADELLSRRGLRTPFLRMAQNGNVIPVKDFTGPGGAGAMIADQVHDEDVLRLFADGATVVLQGLHRTWQPVSGLAAGLARDLGHPVQVNSYITPPQSQGFAPHYDTHDVFVLQVEGRKHWQIHEPVLSEPTADEPWDTVADRVRARAAEPPLLDVTLEPGDCVYLPRGFIHAATAQGETSIHLTFGIHAVTERDIVRALLQALDDSRWRASLPVGWNPTADTGTLAEVRERVLRALADLDLDRVAGALHDTRTARQRPEPLPPLAQAAASRAVGPQTRLRLRAGIAARIDGDDLVHPTGRFAVSAEEWPAMDVLLGAEPVVVGALPLPTERAVAFAARLLREGVAVVIPGGEA